MVREIDLGHSYNITQHGLVSEDFQDQGTPQFMDRRDEIPNFDKTTNFKPKYTNNPEKKPKRTISKFFSNMSRFGMSYEEDIVANMRAIPENKNLLPKNDLTLYGGVLSRIHGLQKTQAEKNFYDKDFDAKRGALQKLSLQPELEDILDTLTNEAVVFDSDHTYFAEPFIEELELIDIKKKFRKEITEAMSKHYRRLYKMLNMKVSAWGMFKRWLIEGILAWEIVWDDLNKDHPKIIGIVSIDPATLTKKFENNKWYWIQYAGVVGRERKLLDAQIIYIEYGEGYCPSRTSYLERLIRPYNIYRIIEQATLIWTVTNSSYKMQFTIPIKGMNKVSGTQTLNSAMNRYKESIDFNVDSGELKINGKTNLPFNKEYWMPESDSGTPSIETLGGDGPELNDNDQLKYFKNQLYKISKVPLNRFDQESSESWMGADATSYLRTEIDFGRFVDRLRNVFSMVIIKPLTLQLASDFPQLEENRQILEAVFLKWNTYNVFTEMKDLEVMQKRVEFIESMKDSLRDETPDGNEVKFFSSKFLVQKYLHLSNADLAANEKLKKEEEEEWNLAGAEDAHGEKNEKIDDIE